MTVLEYEWKFCKLVPYARINENSSLMVQHFIQGLNNHLIGGVKFFQPKTLKDVVHQAILIEKNVTLGYGGFLGAPVASRSKGNQGMRSSRRPYSLGSNQQ